MQRTLFSFFKHISVKRFSRFSYSKVPKVNLGLSRKFFSQIEDKPQIEQRTNQELTEKTNDKETEPRITINLNSIPGTRVAEGGYMVASFVCKKCDTRNTKKFSKLSYQKGIVLIQCEGCKGYHLIADNLGWFEDTDVNIEEMMKRKGEDVKRITCDGLFTLLNDEKHNKV